MREPRPREPDQAEADEAAAQWLKALLERGAPDNGSGKKKGRRGGSATAAADGVNQHKAS